jgi:hypothetical protein
MRKKEMPTNSTLNDRQYHSMVETTRGETPEWSQRIFFGDNSQADAFGRIRMSEAIVTFENFEVLGKNTLNWAESLTGAATIAHVANQSCIKFESSAANGDKATRSSKKLTLYTPGTSLLFLGSGIMGKGAVNSSQRMGLFSAQNGIFFEQKDKVMGVVIRTYTSGSVANNRIDQSDWNIDKFDGTGPTAIDLDFTKTQIFWIDLEWLGVGRVRCGFVHEGKMLAAHEFYHNNILDKVYMKTPILPVTYEIENTGASTALADFRQICCSVVVEGDRSLSSVPRTVSNGITSRATTTTTGVPLVSIKLQTATVGLAMIQPIQVHCLSVGNRDHVFEVHYGGTLESSSWNNVAGLGMVDIAGTHITGSVKMTTVYTATNVRQALDQTFKQLLWVGGDLAGNGDIVSVVARSIGGGGTALAAIDYLEFS